MLLSRTGAVVVAALSGAALYASHPPVGWWWMTFVHAPLLVVALWIDASHGRRSQPFVLGVVSGTAAYAPMISWLIAPAGFVGWGLLFAVQAVWMGLLAVGMARVAHHRWLPLLAGIGWTGMDAWRGIVPLNGFEWGAIAYAHVDSSWLLPVARVLGGRGITLLTVVIGVAVLCAVRVLVTAVRTTGLTSAATALPQASIAISVLVGALLVSALAVTDPPRSDGSMRVLLAQGHDVRFWEDPDPNLVRTVAENLRDDTLQALEDGAAPDVIVWPESAIDRDPDSPSWQFLASIIDEVAAAGGELITGTTLDGPDPSRNRYVAASHYIDGFNEVDRYVKQRLVPFGEYVPFRPLLEWYPPLDQVPRDAIPSDEPAQLITRDGIPIAAVICFETLFTDLVRANIRAGDNDAQIVLTMTNDASFRDTAEPQQHLAQSQLRAVETGRWFVHAALSGSSAFVDPDGTLHDVTDVFTRDVRVRDVPLVQGATPYLVVGDLVGWTTRVLVAIGLIALAVARWRKRDGASEGPAQTR